jgi:peptidase MA superfamily protein/tetratricopeptide repeat protein
VRLRFAIWLLILPWAWADTIHLKNGRTIQADSVRDTGDRVEYDIGDDTYAIPKSAVEHVDTGAGIAGNSAGTQLTATLAAPKINSSNLSEVAPDGKITPERLAHIEASGDKSQLASALMLLAIQEQQHGKTEEALSHMERALNLEPENGNAAATYAWLLLKHDQASLAQGYAEDAVRRSPDSAFAHKILALAYYKNDKIQAALEEFKRAKELDPNDPEVDAYLKAVARQVKTEADFRSDASTHFNMRYEGEKASPKLREQILLVLERHFDDLVSTMGVLPRDPIAVVLYTNQGYFDVTLAPSWTAALNDGKLRIPIEGLTSVTPDLSRVLKHELAHSFIRQATNGRCPVWLNEGLAQLVEPQSAAKFRTALTSVFESGKQTPLQSMESSFIGLDSHQAAIAYIESLAYVEYIRDSYGINRIADIMRNLSEGQSAEESLKAAIHDDYSQLEEEFARHLR